MEQTSNNNQEIRDVGNDIESQVPRPGRFFSILLEYWYFVAPYLCWVMTLFHAAVTVDLFTKTNRCINGGIPELPSTVAGMVLTCLAGLNFFHHWTCKFWSFLAALMTDIYLEVTVYSVPIVCNTNKPTLGFQSLTYFFAIIFFLGLTFYKKKIKLNC